MSLSTASGLGNCSQNLWVAPLNQKVLHHDKAVQAGLSGTGLINREVTATGLLRAEPGRGQAGKGHTEVSFFVLFFFSS